MAIPSSPYRRSFAYRIAQLACWTSERRGLQPRLDPEWLERRALEIAGPPSFRGTTFREPLRRLVESLDAEARLNALGRANAAGNLLQQLVTRACLEQRWNAAVPRDGDLLRPARPPVFIVGLHRTGTTLLQNLLAADPAARPLVYWESSCPLVTVTRSGMDASADTRRLRATTTLAAVQKLAPYLDGIHETRADGPEECYWLLMTSLVTRAFGMQWRIAGYQHWLDGLTEDDWRLAYRFYLGLLNSLDGGMTGRHWVLKCPLHASRIATLARLLPQAIFVQTYRDIRESTGSLCSLTAALRAMGSDIWDPAGDGRDVLASITRSSQAAAAAAAAHPDRVIDVHYRDLVADPIDTVRGIYERAGLPWTTEADAAIHRRQKERSSRGAVRHRYSLADFDLTEAEVLAACPEYVETERRLAAARR